MNKRYNAQSANIFLALLALIGVLLFAIWYMKSSHLEEGFYINLDDLSVEQEEDLISSGEKYTIEISPQGFIPEHIKIEQFDTITFINNDRTEHRPVGVSGECVGLQSSRPLQPLESYSFVLVKKGTCVFEDALSSFPKGEIRISRKAAEK